MNLPAPGLYFLTFSYSPLEKIHTALIIPEKGFSIEISMNDIKHTFYHNKDLNVVFDNQYTLNYNLLKDKINNIHESRYFTDNIEVKNRLQQLISNPPQFELGNSVIDKIEEFQKLKNVESKIMLTTEITDAIVEVLKSYVLKKSRAEYADGSIYLSYAAKQVLEKYNNTLYLDKLSSINPTTAQAISKSPSSVIYMNGLKEITPDIANELGKCKMKLFLNGLRSIDEVSAKHLTNQGVKYLSLRGLNDLTENLKTIFNSSQCFVSYVDKTENGIENKLKYDDEKIKKSVASDKKQFSSIKKLLTTADKAVIDSALLMLSSFSDPYLFDKLLEDVEIVHGDDFSSLHTDKIFKGIKKEQPFFNYAITGILFYAGSDSPIAEQLKSSVTKLNVDIIDVSYLHCFYKLEYLKITDSVNELKSLDGLNSELQLKSLNLKDCTVLESIDALNDIQLESFVFENCKLINSFSALEGKNDKEGIHFLNLNGMKNLENLDGIEFYSSIKKISLQECTNLNDVSALKKIKHSVEIGRFDNPNSHSYRLELPLLDSINGIIKEGLDSLQLTFNNWGQYDETRCSSLKELYITCKGMKNLEWLQFFPNISILSISCDDLLDIKGLKYCASLKKISIYSSAILKLNGIESINNVEEIRLGCSALIDVEELTKLQNIKKIELYGCKSITSLSGVLQINSLDKTGKHLSFYNNESLTEIGDLHE